MLLKSSHCTQTIPSNIASNQSPECFNQSQFCEYTVGSFHYYYEYTLIVCLIPFLLNALLVGINCYRNQSKTLIFLPVQILKHEMRKKDFKDFCEEWPYSRRTTIYRLYNCCYGLLVVLLCAIWIPFLIILYPIATKLASVYVSYKVQVISRAISCKKKSEATTERSAQILNQSKLFYDEMNQSLNSEILKSSTLEVVTESTLQPLLQLYANTSTCGFSETFTFTNLLSWSMLSNPLMFSVVTSLITFSWSMTTYHVSNKNSALGIESNLKGRLLLFGYFLVYITSRMFILVIAAHQIFGGFELFLLFVLLHVVLMCIIHNVHLYMASIGGDYKSLGSYFRQNWNSLDFWIENLINSVGCILIPNNIKYPRTERTENQDSESNEKQLNQRYHEPTSLRYLSMHVIFFMENIILITLSSLNLNTTSSLYVVFEQSASNFIKMFPFWTLGLFFVALGFKFLYYQTHAWPISPNCFRMKFLCPFDKNHDEEEHTEKEDQKEGKNLIKYNIW